MRIRLGFLDEVTGTVEETPAGLIYGGPNPEAVRNLIERMRRSTVYPSDAALLADLLASQRGPHWAVELGAQRGTERDE